MNYESARDLVLAELGQALGQVDAGEVQALADLICRSERVFVVGVGRVLLMLQAFAKRLNHLGVEATFVGAIDEPAITERDLLLVGSGSGESAVPLAIVKIAKEHHAAIAHIGSNPHSSMAAYEDLLLRVPCSTKLGLPGEITSRQPMSSLFEQSLLLLGDTLALMLLEQRGVTDLHALWRKHANLE